MSHPGSLAKSINRYQNVLYSGVRKRLERKGIVSLPGSLAKSINRYYIREGNRVTPLVVSKIDKSISKRIMFARTKRTGTRYY